MRLYLLTFVTSLALWGQSKPAQLDWRFAHPDATLVGGIRPKALMDSSLFTAAISDAGGKDPNTAALAGMATAMLGRITEIRFSVRDNSATKGAEPDVLALITGDLDEAAQGMIPKDKLTVRRIGAHTMLLGKGVSLDRAVKRMASAQAALLPKAVQGSAALVNDTFWIAGQIPDMAKSAPGVSWTGDLAAVLAKSLRSLALGLNLTENFELDLNATTSNAADAEKLVGELRKAEEQQPEQYRGMLQATVEGSTARLHMMVPKEVVLQAMREQQKAATAATVSTRPQPIAPVTPLAPPAPPKPVRRTIIIEGLDSGPREIPLK